MRRVQPGHQPDGAPGTVCVNQTRVPKGPCCTGCRSTFLAIIGLLSSSNSLSDHPAPARLIVPMLRPAFRTETQLFRPLVDPFMGVVQQTPMAAPTLIPFSVPHGMDGGGGLTMGTGSRGRCRDFKTDLGDLMRSGLTRKRAHQKAAPNRLCSSRSDLRSELCSNLRSEWPSESRSDLREAAPVDRHGPHHHSSASRYSLSETGFSAPQERQKRVNL